MEEKKTTPPEKRMALEAIRTEFKGTSGDTQCARLLAALARYLEVSDVTTELRKAGDEIVSGDLGRIERMLTT